MCWKFTCITCVKYAYNPFFMRWSHIFLGIFWLSIQWKLLVVKQAFITIRHKYIAHSVPRLPPWGRVARGRQLEEQSALLSNWNGKRAQGRASADHQKDVLLPPLHTRGAALAPEQAVRLSGAHSDWQMEVLLGSNGQGGDYTEGALISIPRPHFLFFFFSALISCIKKKKKSSRSSSSLSRISKCFCKVQHLWEFPLITSLKRKKTFQNSAQLVQNSNSLGVCNSAWQILR